MLFLPGKKQWASWSLPSKLTAIGTYVGVAGLLLSLFAFALLWRPTPTVTSPDLEVKLLQRIDGFHIRVINLSSVPAKEITVSLHTWQIGAPGPDVMTEFPIRDLAPFDDFTFRVSLNRPTDDPEYNRSRATHPTCGSVVVRSVNGLRPKGWAFFIPGPDQDFELRRTFQGKDPWPMIEFEYPQKAPRGFECIDYPLGVCSAVGEVSWMWKTQ